MTTTLPLGRMRALALLAAAAILALLSASLLAGPAMATQGDQVCGPLSSGKIDVTGNQQTVTITAPAGQLISGYCVKAGSANQGDGPVYVTLAAPVAAITISHPTGKDISHYSYSLVPIPPTPTSVGAQPTLTDVCGPGYALSVPPDAAGYTFSASAASAPGGVGTVVVTATLRAGYIWSDGTTAPKTWSFPVTDAPCTQTASEPTVPTVTDVCGPEYAPNVPADTAAFSYSVDASGVVDGTGTVVIRATLATGHVWPDGTSTVREWSFPVTASPCITQVPAPPAPVADDECGPAYSLEVPADGDGYAFSVDESGVVDGEGVVVVAATLDEGRTWSDGGSDPRVWRLPVTDEDCDIVGGLASPTFHEICGPDGEHPYELPMDGDHHRYVVTDPGTYVDGERVVVVTVELDEGWAAPDASTLTWTHTFSDAPCDSPAALAAIVVTPATCAAPGTVTPGAVTNATWDPIETPSPDGPMPSAAGPDAPATLADDDVELGPAVPVRSLDDVPAVLTEDAAAGSVEVVLVARAIDGARFPLGLPGVSEDGSTRTFTVLVPAADPRLCAQPPVSEPPTTTPPTAVAPRAQASRPVPATLPRTGYDPTGLLVLGSLLALAGVGVVGRRRSDA